MAINFKDVRDKLANATRIAGQLKEVVTIEQSLLRNTRESANRAKASQVLVQLAGLKSSDLPSLAKVAQVI